jgi:hypothetical protein
VEELTKCAHMLLYLNAATWTSGVKSSELAREVKMARRFGIHVLLAHEHPSVADQHCHLAALPRRSKAQLGVAFDSFLNNAEGATPRSLVDAGIYNEIAVR